MASAQLGHPGADQLAGYRLGRLADADASAVAGHLDGCPACRTLLDSLPHETLAELAKSANTALETRAETNPPAAGPPVAGPVPPLPARIGPYRVERLLGRGGMGAVYLARDERLDRAVAVKVPRLDAGEGPEAAERFRREARAAATIEHPNVCPVYEVGEDAGVPYLAMRFVEGRPLSEALKGGKCLPPRQAAALAGKVALALHEAHRKGVVHRDLKPANIMLAGGREPVVMDFGLARQLTRGETRLTQSGTILGTPAYMSPEQVAADAANIGPATDVYSLGVILYEMLTGRLPFDGPITAVLGLILTADPPSPLVHRPELDPALVRIVQRAMARKPADRFVSMAEMAAALSSYVRTVGQGGPASMVAPGAAPTVTPVGADDTGRRTYALQADDIAPAPAAPAADSATAVRKSGTARRRKKKRKRPSSPWSIAATAGGIVLMAGVGALAVFLGRKVLPPTHGAGPTKTLAAARSPADDPPVTPRRPAPRGPDEPAPATSSPPPGGGLPADRPTAFAPPEPAMSQAREEERLRPAFRVQLVQFGPAGINKPELMGRPLAGVLVELEARGDKPELRFTPETAKALTFDGQESPAAVVFIAGGKRSLASGQVFPGTATGACDIHVGGTRYDFTRLPVLDNSRKTRLLLPVFLKEGGGIAYDLEPRARVRLGLLFAIPVQTVARVRLLGAELPLDPAHHDPTPPTPPPFPPGPPPPGGPGGFPPPPQPGGQGGPPPVLPG